WEDRGLYLYVEQALSTKQDKPYRQRVYKVSRLNDNTLQTEIFKLEADSDWIGKWKDPKSFSRLTEDDLILRNGCEVLLRKAGNQNYKGSTGEKICESTMRGASYATSEVEILKGKIISWDRGFDASGTRKWGAEKGGYIFKKLERVYRTK
ncbi:MAG: CpeT protein, partial [Candidatus Azotimanducaceae bacterium]